MMAAVLALGPAWLAGAADFAMHARVSFDAGGAMIKGTDDPDWGQAMMNTLVMPGDTVWVDKEATSEIEFAGGTFMRLADGSKAEVTQLPPNGLARGWRGSFYVQRLSRAAGDFVFATPACKVQIERSACVRVDVIDNGATTVSVRWGRVTVQTDAGGAEAVSEGERVWVDPGMLPSAPTPFDRSEEDVFDAWNRDRTKLLAGGPAQTAAKRVVIDETVIGASDLAPYGEWIEVDNRSYWRPTVVTDYVPYRTGYWSCVPSVGQVWVESYPFSYVTCHYGRWTHHEHYGWIWGYDPVWSPAWVASVHCGDYLMWAPVDWDCRPVIVHSSATFMVGGIAFGIDSCSYVRSDYLMYGPTYVTCMDPVAIDYFHHHEREVNVWNINLGHHDPIRVPYGRPLGMDRDFNPRRSIRNPQMLSEHGIAAHDRVRSLEASVGRDRFSAIDKTGGRGVRTIGGLKAEGRIAHTRSVHMDANVTAHAPLPGARGAQPARSEGRGEGRGANATDRTTRGAGEGRGPKENAATPARTTNPGREGRTDRGQTANPPAETRQAHTPDRTAPRDTVRNRAESNDRSAMQNNGRTQTPDRGQDRNASARSAAPRTNDSSIERTAAPRSRSVDRAPESPRVTERPARNTPRVVEPSSTPAQPAQRAMEPDRGRSSNTQERRIDPSNAGRNVQRAEPRAESRMPSRSSAAPRSNAPSPGRDSGRATRSNHGNDSEHSGR
jgi:hypothetical protein